VVTEIKATAALKATLEGYRVMPMDEAARIGDIFITATGMKDVIIGRHFQSMKDGALVCNTGHYDCEINLVDLEAQSKSKREVRKDNEEYTLKDGRRVYVLGQGRLINLAAAEGHPSEVMDMSFANQFLGMLKLAREGKTLDKQVYELPPAQDQEIALTKLTTMGLAIDQLTAEQAKYATDYSAGT
jgi:adenosylhomocysteinase